MVDYRSLQGIAQQSGDLEKWRTMSYFDEQWYLTKYADVKAGVSEGKFSSGRDHFERRGKSEGRLPCDPKLSARLAEADKLVFPNKCKFERLYVTLEGIGLIFGWIDDRTDRVCALSFIPHVGDPIPLEQRFSRLYRQDVADSKGKNQTDFEYGVWILFDGLAGCLPHLGGRVKIEFVSGSEGEAEIAAEMISSEEMRGRVLDAINSPRRRQSSPSELARIAGPGLRRLNSDLLARASVSSPVLHGRGPTRFHLSVIVVCQRPDSLLRHAAFFAEVSGKENVEFVCFGSKPDTASLFHAMAESAWALYGLSSLSLTTQGSIGVALANSEAAQVASGETLLFLGEGVVPGDSRCLERCLFAADRLKENDVVGAQLLAEDNSVLRLGRALKLADPVNRLWGQQELLKGFWPEFFADSDLMDVQAVSASAMLVRRSSFLELGGFDANYLTDEYQDVDYCLRARRAGGRVAVDTRLFFNQVERRTPFLRPPRESAATLMDQVLFNDRWRSVIEAAPDHEQLSELDSRAETTCQQNG